MTPRPHDAPDRLRFLDSIRGLAALSVLGFHMVLVPEPNLGVPGWALPVVRLGGYGVTLFFVCSGFTLCHMHSVRRGERHAVARFYVRRFARIAPLYYAWLLVMAYLTERLRGHSREMLMYLMFAFNPVPGRQEGLVMASWTLGIEMPFYLLFPALARHVASVRGAVTFYLLAVALAVGADAVIGAVIADPVVAVRYDHFSFFRHLPSFAVGAVAYAVYSARPEPRRRTGLWLLTTSVGVFLGVAFWVRLDVAAPGEAEQRWLIGVMAPVCGLLLLGLAWAPVRVAVNRVTAAAGLISYSVYLNHPLIVVKLAGLYRAIYAEGWGLGVSLAVCFVVTLVPVVMVSCITYLLIERPGMRAGHWLARRL